ncbi:MAG: xanthine dehydrogenase family protein subunit M [SAR324 cluster bacterium]|nr:xanthine dehydrogenase family protein subunit M [SAR324 cluster bacterium]
MKAPIFDYIKANSLSEVFDLMEKWGEDARIIAGGQSLVPAMNFRLTTPSLLIDINGIEELKGITHSQSTLNIGALTRHYELGTSEEVTKHAPLLSKAVPHIAHEAIRSRGTFGGSLVHADPSAEIPACAMVLDGRFQLQSRQGCRSVSARDFFKGLFETAMEPGEILVSADFDVNEDGYQSALCELERRQGDYATIGVAARAKTDSGNLFDLRLVYFALEDKPILANHAAAILEGSRGDEAAIAAAKTELTKDLNPIGDLHTSANTKLHLAKVLLERVVKNLLKHAKGTDD